MSTTNKSTHSVKTEQETEPLPPCESEAPVAVVERPPDPTTIIHVKSTTETICKQNTDSCYLLSLQPPNDKEVVSNTQRKAASQQERPNIYHKSSPIVGKCCAPHLTKRNTRAVGVNHNKQPNKVQVRFPHRPFYLLVDSKA